MEKELAALLPDQPFAFACRPGIACFNACCQDLHQVLFPYDILRLKNHLDMESARFLQQYTQQQIGPQTGLPVITLRFGPGRTCPFVSEAGCTVYPARPASCRAYPLARMSARNRQTGRIEEQYVLLEEDHCLGFGEPETQTVAEWVRSQGLAPYNRMNDRMMEIIALKNQYHPRPLDIREQVLFHVALYDLDTFRQQVFSDDLFKDHPVDAARLEAARADDEALLAIAFDWVKTALFRS